MTKRATYTIVVESAPFLGIGRMVQRGFGKRARGEVRLTVAEGQLTIEVNCGGGEIACEGDGEISAALIASSFCTLFTSRFREKAPSGPLEVLFLPGPGEVAVAGTRVRAKFQ